CWVSVFLSGLIVKIVLPPISIMLSFWHIGLVPPPHSLVTMSFLPSLLNAAVCRPWKLLVSLMAAIRTGFSGFEISTRMPELLHAPNRRCNSGYDVTRWPLRGPVGSGAGVGGAFGSAPGRGPRGAAFGFAGRQNFTQSGLGSRPVKIRAHGMTLAFSGWSSGTLTMSSMYSEFVGSAGSVPFLHFNSGTSESGRAAEPPDK